MLFDDEFIDAKQAATPSAVAKALRSARAKAKGTTRLAEDGIPVRSSRTLMQDLATLTYNIIDTALNAKAEIILTTRPTPLHEKDFALLGVNPCVPRSRPSVAKLIRTKQCHI